MNTCHTSFISLLLHIMAFTRFFVENSKFVRGIPNEKIDLYASDKDFLCLDGTLTIPSSYINDDYCDCLDASDEPGTSACPNGTFYCLNIGHVPLFVPSSRVNDGICDCCDGSDEWANNVQKDVCQNVCKELNFVAKQKSIRINNLYERGLKIREQLIVEGKYLLSQKKNAILKLQNKHKNALLIKNKALTNKEIAEAKVKKAMIEESLIEQRQAFQIFNEIDTNKNNKIEVEEVIAYSIFDQNKDGLVSDDETNYFMANKKELDFYDFLAYCWDFLKLVIYTKPIDKNDYTNVKKENQNRDSNQHDFNNGIGKINNTKIEPDKINKLLYNNITKILIDESLKASKLLDEANKIVIDIEKTIYDLQKSIMKDFGLENEFAALDGKCYDFTDYDYTYQLCLFEKVTQKSIKGGSDINLGVWNNWTNSINTDTKYHTMLYNNGHTCQNSHQRFTHVHLNCGLKPRILSVMELNRCEYLIEFEVPSVCVFQDNKYLKEEREEL